MIRVCNLHKSFGDREILRGVSFAVEKGRILYIIGTSGVGKSVAIKHIIGLLKADTGEIWLDQTRIDEYSERQMFAVRKRVGMVFQHATLFDSMTLRENVALPLVKHQNMRRKPALEKASEYLAKVGLVDRQDQTPALMADGMRKQAAIARTMAMDPECMLFDEPTTGLDPSSAREIDSLIRSLSVDAQMTSIVVSHDLPSIMSVADEIAFLYRGSVYLSGTPQEFRSSKDPVVQQFISGRASGPMETPGF